MTLGLFVRYLHFLGLFIWVGALVAEWILLRTSLPRATVKRLAIIDRWYGLGAVVVVGTGFLQWFVVGKPAEFYNGNHLFYLKVGLATVVGLLSIYPTVFFAKNSKGDDPSSIVAIPSRVKQVVGIQLGLMVIIPMLATLMAAGVGYRSPEQAESPLAIAAREYRDNQDYASLQSVMDQLPAELDTATVRQLLGEPIDMGFDYRYLTDSVGPNGCAVGAVFHIASETGLIDQRWVDEICE
ncbi:MAG: DUF2214 family protein [Bacteroidota bacterium]